MSFPSSYQCWLSLGVEGEENGQEVESQTLATHKTTHCRSHLPSVYFFQIQVHYTHLFHRALNGGKIGVYTMIRFIVKHKRCFPIKRFMFRGNICAEYSLSRNDTKKEVEGSLLLLTPLPGRKKTHTFILNLFWDYRGKNPVFLATGRKTLCNSVHCQLL